MFKILVDCHLESSRDNEFRRSVDVNVYEQIYLVKRPTIARPKPHTSSSGIICLKEKFPRQKSSFEFEAIANAARYKLTSLNWRKGIIYLIVSIHSILMIWIERFEFKMIDMLKLNSKRHFAALSFFFHFCLLPFVFPIAANFQGKTQNNIDELINNRINI